MINQEQSKIINPAFLRDFFIDILIMINQPVVLVRTKRIDLVCLKKKSNK
jgi:hypothetical protein